MPELTTIGFDADDTLSHHERFYQLTQQRFAELLREHADPHHLAEHLLAAERRNVGHYGFGVKGFTLDRELGSFVLTHDNIRVPETTSEFAINMSNQRHWEAPVKRYVSEMLAGKEGVLGKNYNMRWIASMVADVHRILTRGGIFMYPRDAREPEKPGKLRLMYEANPMSFIIEQAGGAATNGTQRILDIQPDSLHQRVAVFLGSKEEVERVTGYHQA